MFDMFGKISEMKEKMETVKQSLDTIDVTGQSPDGRIKILMTANKTVKSIEIEEALISTDNAEELEDLLIIAINRTIEIAEATAQEKIKSATAGMLPNIPGLM